MLRHFFILRVRVLERVVIGLFVRSKLYRLHTNLTKLKNLRELDVSYTDINYHNLDLVCDHLRNLEALNISGTRVDSIVALQQCTRLKRLSMADLSVSVRRRFYKKKTP